MASSSSRSEVDEDRYFFDNITSEEAEEILKKENGDEGTFLIRKSCSSPGNYVLSFITQGNPFHILIQKIGEDSFFHLVIPDEPLEVFHGIDMLVNHHRQHPVGQSMTPLCYACVGQSLPAELRLYGASSLLHRTTTEGNVKILEELLKNKGLKINGKNNNGQTAIHIACMKGFEEMTRLLIEAKADVDTKDVDGLTALHLASRYNRPGIVRLLVVKGHADIQARSPKTGSVALHDAAEYGNIMCAKELLKLGAPSCPRNKALETPALLAQKNGYTSCYDMLVNHRPNEPELSLKEYYHGQIDRQVAKERLTTTPNARSGHFLLRQSAKKAGTYVLTLLYQGQVYNYEISREGVFFCMDDGPYFQSLEIMIDHYRRVMDGLPCRLHTPVPPQHFVAPEEHPGGEYQHGLHDKTTSDTGGGSLERQPLLAAMSQDDLSSSLTSMKGFTHTPNITLTRPGSGGQEWENELIDLHSPALGPDALQQQITSQEDFHIDLQNLTTRDHEIRSKINSSPTMDGNKTDEIFGTIDFNSLQISCSVGNGEFGAVWKGIWNSPSGDKIDVAVKILHDNNKVNKEDFLREAKVMMNLNHRYIVNFIGVCHGPQLAMVQELLGMGSLLNLLLDRPEQIDVNFHLMIWAAQIAEGMHYLEEKHFVHRDLAARNILLSSMTLAKISDFGLSRAVGATEDFYTASVGGKWPVKWLAPECIYYGTFTHRSDVWSYGITLWEMYTFGDQPYGDLPTLKIVELLEADERLPPPEKCPEDTFHLMLQCWSFDPKERPSFQELAVIFKTKPEYKAIKNYFK